MKIKYLIVLICLSFQINAQIGITRITYNYFPAEVFYSDGSSEKMRLSYPIHANAKTVKAFKDDHNKNIKIDISNAVAVIFNLSEEKEVIFDHFTTKSFLSVKTLWAKREIDGIIECRTYYIEDILSKGQVHSIVDKNGDIIIKAPEIYIELLNTRNGVSIISQSTSNYKFFSKQIKKLFEGENSEITDLFFNNYKKKFGSYSKEDVLEYINQVNENYPEN